MNFRVSQRVVLGCEHCGYELTQHIPTILSTWAKVLVISVNLRGQTKGPNEELLVLIYGGLTQGPNEKHILTQLDYNYMHGDIKTVGTWISQFVSYFKFNWPTQLCLTFLPTDCYGSIQNNDGLLPLLCDQMKGLILMHW